MSDEEKNIIKFLTKYVQEKNEHLQFFEDNLKSLDSKVFSQLKQDKVDTAIKTIDCICDYIRYSYEYDVISWDTALHLTESYKELTDAIEELVKNGIIF